MHRIIVRTMATDFLRVKDKFLSMSLEERRQNYNVREWIDPASIPTPEFGPRTVEKYPKTYKKVFLWSGDITTLEVDAIVNAANSRLAAGGGVCGAIHRVAGKELAAECDSIGKCPTSEAVITGGYRLPAKYVIHAVGPMGEKSKELEDTYRSIMQLCEENNLKTVAIPCISTGIYGYPQEKAAGVAVSTVLDAVPECVEKVILCTFLHADTEEYIRLLAE